MSDEGGFDVQAYQRGQNSPDKALLVTFEYVAEKKIDGTFENVEYIRIWLGRNDEIVRKCTDQDRRRFADRYESFKKGEAQPPSGTPISQCPFATPANVSACKAERIFTLEQLVEIADERLQRPALTNFKYQCIDFLKSVQRHGYLGELRAQIQRQEKEIEILRERLADQGKDTSVAIPAKRRGRPPKVTDGDPQVAA